MISVMERIKKTIDISKGHPVIRLPFDFTDRLRAEGIKEVTLSINDVTEVITIRPVRPVKK